MIGEMYGRRTPKSSDEKPRTASIGPMMQIPLKERVNEITTYSRKGYFKDKTPLLIANTANLEIMDDEVLKPNARSGLKSESFSTIRPETSSRSMLLSKPALVKPRGGLDLVSRTSTKDNTDCETNPSFKSDKKSEKPDPDCQFSAEDEKVYGRRGMPGYEKIKLLGKGGQGLVWLAHRKSDGLMVAMKQIALGGFVNEKVARKELDIDELIFQKNEGDDELVLIGKKSLICVLDHLKTPKDMFIILELGGQCLSKQVYTMKGEFMKSERIYKVVSTNFRSQMLLSFMRYGITLRCSGK